MMISIRRALAASAASAVSLAMLGSLASPAAAATVRPLSVRPHATATNAFSVLHTFMGTTDGLAPQGDLDIALKSTGNDSYSETLWGETLGGGNESSGTIFNLLVGSSTLNTTYQFAGTTDGDSPLGGLASNETNYFGSGGTQLGVTVSGGANAEGNVYALSGSGAVTSVYSFTGGADGAFPAGRITQFTDGNYYGTTTAGGTYGYGTIFKISPKGAFTALYSFTGQADGASPAAGLSLLANQNGKANTARRGSVADVALHVRAMSNKQYISPYLYGTTSSGGANNAGTIFRITTAGKLTTIYAFDPTSVGASPQAKLSTDLSGNLYGTTSASGTNGNGAVFKLAQGASAPTILYAFPASGATGASPLGQILVAFDGNLYGTTSTSGANGYGTIFEITSKGVFSDIHDFDFTDGATSQGGLVDGGNGILYGTTSDGGIGNGVLFQIAG